jgi:hypothetical protein
VVAHLRLAGLDGVAGAAGGGAGRAGGAPTVAVAKGESAASAYPTTKSTTRPCFNTSRRRRVRYSRVMGPATPSRPTTVKVTPSSVANGFGFGLGLGQPHEAAPQGFTSLTVGLHPVQTLRPPAPGPAGPAPYGT